MKIRSLVFSGLLLSGMATAQSHKFEWVKTMGGTSIEACRSMVTDKDGNVYTSGLFRGTADFDPGPGIQTLTAVSSAYDLFVSKLDKNGDFVWAKQLSGTDVKQGTYLKLDTTGNIYLTGSFFGSVDFDPGPGSFELTADSTMDLFVAKYDNSGALLWAKQMGGIYNYCSAKSISTDDMGNVYTSGIINDTVDFDPGPGETKLYSTGFSDVYISKLDKDGNFAWAKVFGNTDAYFDCDDLSIDHSGNLYLVGNFSGTIDFDPGAGVVDLTATLQQSLILKLDPAGDYVWVKQIESDSINITKALAFDKSDNIYIAGNFKGTADLDPGAGTQLLKADSMDVYVLKLSKEGDFIWTRQFGGPSLDYAAHIITDTADHIYVGGIYNQTADFDPGTGKFMLNSAGSGDIFYVKLTPSGDFVWAKSMGGSNNDNITKMASDQELNLYTAGTFSGTIDFNPATATAYATAAGSSDIFVHKMSLCTPSIAPDTFTTRICKSYTFGEVTYTQPGIYTQMLSNSGGCDSMVTLELTTEIITAPDTIIANFCGSITFGDVTYSKAGIYTQTLSTPDGCDSIVTLKLTTDPVVDMTVTKTGNTLEAATADKTYQWVECPSMNFVPGATGRSFTPAKNGSYAVIVYVHPCRYTSACTNISGLGIDETEQSIQAQVYPSPVQHTLFVTTKESLKQARLILINLQGQQVLSQENVSGNNVELDLSGQASGVYFLKIVSPGQASEVIKIIKE